MLIGKLYTLENYTSEDSTVKALISFDRTHPIFEGHFPGHPVVPGVCMMQILREIMERVVKQKLKIVSGENIKFLSIINPAENKNVEVSISYSDDNNALGINASLFAGTVTFFKFKGTFQKYE